MLRTATPLVILLSLAIPSAVSAASPPSTLQQLLAEHRYSCKVYVPQSQPFIEYVTASSAEEARRKVEANLPSGWWVDPCHRVGG